MARSGGENQRRQRESQKARGAAIGNRPAKRQRAAWRNEKKKKKKKKWHHHRGAKAAWRENVKNFMLAYHGSWRRK